MNGSPSTIRAMKPIKSLSSPIGFRSGRSFFRLKKNNRFQSLYFFFLFESEKNKIIEKQIVNLNEMDLLESLKDIFFAS